MIQKVITLNFKEPRTLSCSPKKGMNKVKNYFCKFCEKKAQFFCKNCKRIFYCSKICQRNDWPIHKYRCNSNNLIIIPYKNSISRIKILKIILLNKGDRIDYCKLLINKNEQIIFNIFSVVFDDKNNKNHLNFMLDSSYLNMVKLLEEHILNYFLLIQFLYYLDKKNREVACNIFLLMIYKFEKYFDLILNDLSRIIPNGKLGTQLYNYNKELVLSLLKIFGIFYNYSLKFVRISAQRKFLVKYLKTVDLISLKMNYPQTIFVRNNLLLNIAYLNINKYNPLKTSIICLERIIYPFSHFYKPFYDYKINFKIELFALFNLSLILYVNGQNKKALKLLNQGEILLEYKKDEIEDFENENYLNEFNDFYYNLMKKICILETEIMIDCNYYELAYKKVIEALKYLKLGFNRRKLVTFNKKDNSIIEKSLNKKELRDKKFICFFFDLIVRKLKMMKNFQNLELKDLKSCFDEIYNSSLSFKEEIEDINNIYENNLRNFLHSEKKNILFFNKNLIQNKYKKFPSFNLNLDYDYNTLSNSLNEEEMLNENKKNKKVNHTEIENPFDKKPKNPETINSKEINKFFLFINKLSYYQIKILNETQPKISNKKLINSVPIYFSNQFLDVLNFEQRLMFYDINIFTLLRFAVLADPEKEISINNLNYTLINLKERTLVEDDSFSNSSNDSFEKYSKSFIQFLKKIENYDKKLVEGNNIKQLNKMFNNLNKQDIKDILDHPSLIYDIIKSDKIKKRKIKKEKKL